jgi:hypothetical protein
MVNAIRNRFPSRKELLSLLWVIVLPTHVWTILVLLKVVPGFILRMSAWELLCVIAYIQATTLVECILILGLLVLFCGLLPGRVLRDHFVFKGIQLVLLSSICAALFHFLPKIANLAAPLWSALLQRIGGSLNPDTLNWIQSEGFLDVFFLFLLAISYPIFVIGIFRTKQFNQKLQDFVPAFIERLNVLSSLYVVIDLVALLLVLGLNIF